MEVRKRIIVNRLRMTLVPVRVSYKQRYSSSPETCPCLIRLRQSRVLLSRASLKRPLKSVPLSNDINIEGSDFSNERRGG